jgi:hypothetical protein
VSEERCEVCGQTDSDPDPINGHIHPPDHAFRAPPATDGAAFRRTMPCCGSDFGDGDYNDLRARVAELEGSNEANVAMIAKQRAMLLDAQGREERLRAHLEAVIFEGCVVYGSKFREFERVKEAEAALAERKSDPDIGPDPDNEIPPGAR